MAKKYEGQNFVGIFKNAGSPPIPIVPVVLFKATMNPPIEAPIIDITNGNLYLIFIPNIAGSVTPKKAETAEVIHNDLNLLSFFVYAIAKAADHCAIFDIILTGHKYVIPTDAINCKSSAINV